MNDCYRPTIGGDGFTSGVGGGTGAGWNGVQVYYVGKHGLDTNTGLNLGKAFLTFGAAIAAATAQTPSSINQFAIVCLDAGRYTESVTVPAWVHLFAPEATLANAAAHVLSLSANSSARVGTLVPINTGWAGLRCAAGPTRAHVGRILSEAGAYGVLHAGGELECTVDYIETDTQGLAGRGIFCQASAGELVCTVGLIRIPDDGEAIYNDGAAGGRLRVGEVRLEGAGATAVEQQNPGDNLDVQIDLVHEVSVAASGFVLGATAGTVTAYVGRLAVTNGLSVGVNSTLRAFFCERAGSVAGGGAIHLYDAARVRETGGPTDLNWGAIAAGEYVQRSGTSLVGAALAITGFVHGFEYAPNAVTPLTQIDIEPGTCRNDADDGDIAFASTVTLNAATTGANGLDVGALAANTWYYIWAITDGTTPASLLSLSASAPTLPGAYNRKRRIGVARTDGAANLRAMQVFGQGATKKAYYPDDSLASLTVLAAGNAIAWAAVSLAAHVPPIAERVELWTAFDAALFANIAQIRRNGSAQATPVWQLQNVGNACCDTAELHALCDATQQIQYQVTAVGDALSIAVQAFEFEV